MGVPAQARLTSAERFELLEQLGSGGNGTVHRARDTALGIEVAIKILARTEGLDVYRFKREFRAFSGVLHPNLVRLYELFADDAQWFFSMELVRGVPFDEYVRAPAFERHGCARRCTRPRMRCRRSIASARCIAT